MRKRSSGLFLIIAAAVAGYAALTLPPAIAQSYDSIHRVNPTLALAYLCLVGALAAIVAVFLVSKTWQMWRRSRRKAKPHKLPSAMTKPQIEREIQHRQKEASEYLDAVKGPEREELAGRLSAEREKLASQTLE